MQKQIRRRRAVLALLVVISLALLTEYFGESSNSPLHSIQRGIGTVLTPVQEGASTVFSPVRDLASSVSTMFSDKAKLHTLQKQYDTLKDQYAALQAQDIDYRQARNVLKLDENYGLDTYGPLTGNVIEQDPLLWYDAIKVDRGSASGVREWDPVVGAGGLIGRVIEVGSNQAEVALVTSPKFAVGAEIENLNGAPGVVEPDPRSPSELTMIDLPTTSASNISTGQLVVTSGFAGPSCERSFAPAGIPIGTIANTNPQSSLLVNGALQVTPLADLENLRVVQILTRPHDQACQAIKR